MTTTHEDLIESAQAIGAIAESAGWYTARLVERINRMNRLVETLTVAELIELDAELRAEVQRAYGEAMA